MPQVQAIWAGSAGHSGDDMRGVSMHDLSVAGSQNQPH